MARAIVITLLCLVGALLFLRDIPYILTAQGHCLAWNQPSILLGFSPSFTTELACVSIN